MKLIDLISTINENDRVKVYDTELTLIATADGKDSIPEALNDVEVVGFHPAGAGELNVEVKIEGGKASPILFKLPQSAYNRILDYKDDYEGCSDKEAKERIRWRMSGYVNALGDVGILKEFKEKSLVLSYMEGEI